MPSTGDKTGPKIDSRVERVAFLLKELQGDPQVKDRDAEFVDNLEDRFSSSSTFTLAPWEVNKLEAIYAKLK